MSLFESIEANASLPDPASIPAAMRRAAMLEHPTLAVAAVQKGRIRETNGPWKSLFALPVGVSVESHVATLFPNLGSGERFERSLAAALAGTDERIGQSARVEHMLARRDGSAFLAEIVLHLSDDDVESVPLHRDAVWQVRDITVERTLRRELRDLEDYHRELSRHQWDLTFVIDRKGRISYASSSIETALGYRVESMLGEPFTSLLDPAHAGAAEQWLRAASRQKEDEPGSDGFPLHVLHSDGRERILACRPRDCFAVPRIAGMVVHARDITDTVADPAATFPAQLRHALIELASDTADDVETRIVSLLERTRSALGVATSTLTIGTDESSRTWRSTDDATAGVVDTSRSPRAPSPAPWSPLIVDDLRTASLASEARERSTLHAGEIAFVEVPVIASGALQGWLCIGERQPRRWSGVEIDFLMGVGLLIAPVIVSRSPENGVRDGRDPLTDLPGRVAVASELTLRAARAKRIDSLAALLVSLDRMQDLNDAHGLDIGDLVLGHAARRIVQGAGSDAFVARVTGDEFLVLVEGLSLREVEALSTRLLDAIGETDVDGGLPHVEASIGIAAQSSESNDAQALLARAHLAAREAKKKGGGQVVAFDPRLDATLEQRKALDADIERGLEKGEFVLFYQPQLSLATGVVVGLEALARWEHPTRGLLLPAAFIGTAFRRGLIETMTKVVLTLACEQIATWRRAGDLPELPVTINVSGRQLTDRRLPALVASALLKSGLPARLLILEINEQSLAADDASIERVVKELSRLGVRVAISDFNMGHASFGYQRQLNVSQIKLHAGFVKQLPADAGSAIVVAGLVDVARRLKYEVIAEGVETREQFDCLRSIGCEAGQGFYFGAPLSADEIRLYLESNLRSPFR